MKVYAGAPAAARVYLEADRGRADDYYLAEGTGLARRFVGRDGRVQERASLTGDGYETWVAGRDPDTGVPRGRLRTDDRAVRFVEVVVNGPKSWSLAAAVHPDVAEAYDAAQDRAAAEIIGWLAVHATTRVGPRGGQVQVPVEVLEAVTVRHYTSRAGDPHRHLHLQIGARVFADGRWRGLHTVGVRDFLVAINGIGHAAVACDPQFRAVLAAHGYTLDETGEILELAEYIGPFSARAAEIGRNLFRYERDWIAAYPGEAPGPALRRAWDARAWAEGRPDKVTPRSAADLVARWRGELAALGYRDPARPVALAPTQVGALDRDHTVEQILTRLGAGRSAWNATDLRGEAERLIAAEGVVVEAAVRVDLAEDLTARALARCVSLLARGGVPEHVRAWTSPAVLDVEADVTARLAARSTMAEADRRQDSELPRAGLARLDTGQAAAATALAGDRRLIVVEGAAGAGKTRLLAATRDLLDAQSHRLMVVTPTLKAAKIAATEVGAATGSAAWLAFEHGWRWSDDGAWTRLTLGQADPVTGLPYAGPRQTARLAAGDLLVVDEAGMLDQDTARALLTVADEYRVRLALLGDRHQLAAVGRGGVLDLAAGQVEHAAHVVLDAVHRFTRTDQAGQTVPDTEYAELTLAMRTGADPGAVFDALAARGRLRVHADPVALQGALAATAAVCCEVGERVAVVVDTREQAAELGAAIRDRMVAGGRVDDTRIVTTGAGQRIGVGDRVATRRNDSHLGVANREVWTVTAVDGDGRLTVTPTAGNVTPAEVTPCTPRERLLPADYVATHVELAYVSTAHGVQGDTVAVAHVVIGEHTGAAAAYVGMTRGRTANTAHLIAADLAEARAQWIAVFGRDRADLGPAHAAAQAAAEAARYANPRSLDAILAELHAAWTIEQRCRDRLTIQEPMRAALQKLVAIQSDPADRRSALTGAYQQAGSAAEEAKQRVEKGDAAVAAEADRFREALLRLWDSERGAASAAARVVLDGPGRLGFRRGAVARAGEQLLDWADRWRPYVPELPADPAQLAQVAGWFDDRPALWAALDAYARRAADHAHPERDGLRAAVEAAQRTFEQVRRTEAEARRQADERTARFGALERTSDPETPLADVDHDIAATRQQLAAARARIAHLTAEPAVLAQPAGRLAQERDAWRIGQDAERAARRTAAPAASPPRSTRSMRPPEPVLYRMRSTGTGPGIGR